MVIVQQPSHQQQQERNRNEAQILEKWKTLLQQNLHLLRKIARYNSNRSLVPGWCVSEEKFE